MIHPVRHPGEVLRNDFMAPLGISAEALAMALHVPSTRITDIITKNDPRPVTEQTALLLASYFETMPNFWMNLQIAYDLSRTSGTAARPRAICSSEDWAQMQDL